MTDRQQHMLSGIMLHVSNSTTVTNMLGLDAYWCVNWVDGRHSQPTTRPGVVTEGRVQCARICTNGKWHHLTMCTYTMKHTAESCKLDKLADGGLLRLLYRREWQWKRLSNETAYCSPTSGRHAVRQTDRQTEMELTLPLYMRHVCWLVAALTMRMMLSVRDKAAGQTPVNSWQRHSSQCFWRAPGLQAKLGRKPRNNVFTSVPAVTLVVVIMNWQTTNTH